MNSKLYELTGVKEEEAKKFCEKHLGKFYKPSVKRRFFTYIQNGDIIRNKEGELVWKQS